MPSIPRKEGAPYYGSNGYMNSIHTNSSDLLLIIEVDEQQSGIVVNIIIEEVVDENFSNSYELTSTSLFSTIT